MDKKQAKQRFGIIGEDSELERAIDIALQVAPTDISVLVFGESGTGKENIPKIIHQNSKRKHNTYSCKLTFHTLLQKISNVEQILQFCKVQI